MGSYNAFYWNESQKAHAAYSSDIWIDILNRTISIFILSYTTVRKYRWNKVDIIKSISNQCDVISNRLWRHQQNVNRAGETRVRCMKSFLSSFMDPLCRVRNKILYVLSWLTVYAFSRVLFGINLSHCCTTREIYTKIALSWAHK